MVVYICSDFKIDNMEYATGGKTMYTVLLCVSGQYMPPLTVYKGKNLHNTWTKGGSDTAIFAIRPSGMM